MHCVDPGPTDTGWADPDRSEEVRRVMPRGRWNTAREAVAVAVAVAVVAWLTGRDARSVTGQTIDAEGGLRRPG